MCENISWAFHSINSRKLQIVREKLQHLFAFPCPNLCLLTPPTPGSQWPCQLTPPKHCSFLIISVNHIMGRVEAWNILETQRRLPSKEATCQKIRVLGHQSCKTTFFHPVSGFSIQKCPNYVFAEFCHHIIHWIDQMLVFFLIFLIWSWTGS